MSQQKLTPQKSTDLAAKPTVEAPSIEPLILWVSGGKGGVGKTTTARILTDLLADKTEYVYGYDCDPINPQFKRFYGAEFLPITSPDTKTADIAVETLAERIENKANDYIIIDSPAGEVDLLGLLEERFAFVSNLRQMGARLTRVLVLSTTLESVNLLEHALSNAKGLPVAHVAVRNLHFGGPHYFDAYNRSSIKTELEKQGGMTVDFPELGAIASSSIDQNSLTYSDAIEKASGLPTMRRSMVYQWRENVRKEFSKAGHLLGVEA
ncbi:MAG: hypothetical protein HC800_13110 [Phormidesmis sp. RL_2_1]|nr:hypothetical protein [Phormidesmis sp. RL_2_1]